MILQTGQKNKAAGRCTKHGFTLIELSLVTVILVILVGVSAPLFRRTYISLELNETAENIGKFMEYGQAMAVNEKINTRLAFDFDVGSYRLTVSKESGTSALYSAIDGRMGRSFSVPGTVELSGDDNTLDFYPSGRSEAFKLFLESSSGKRILIELGSDMWEPVISDYEG